MRAGSVRNLVYEAVPDGPSSFGADGLLASLTARLVERVTEAELDHHLRAEADAGRKNTRNGRTKRRLLSARGGVDLLRPLALASEELLNRSDFRPPFPEVGGTGGVRTVTTGHVQCGVAGRAGVGGKQRRRRLTSNTVAVMRIGKDWKLRAIREVRVLRKPPLPCFLRRGVLHYPSYIY